MTQAQTGNFFMKENMETVSVCSKLSQAKEKGGNWQALHLPPNREAIRKTAGPMACQLCLTF
jgi:hypothetical protein